VHEWVAPALLCLILASCGHGARRGDGASGGGAHPTGSALPAPQARKCERFCERIAACPGVNADSRVEALLCGIARCETGNKCIASIRSPGGRYQGAFQFARATWQSICYPVFDARRGMAACRRPEARNDLCCAAVCAREMLGRDERGLRNWPVCGKRAAESD
jgi:hypothetical protein